DRGSSSPAHWPVAQPPGSAPAPFIRMAPAPTEQELAASCLSLLAQPALWPQLRLPPPTAARAAEAPWATYWATRVDAALDVAEARALLEAAFATFTTQQDRLGELLCLAAIIESYYVD